jgi:integrase
MAIEIIHRKGGKKYRAVVRIHHKKQSRTFDRKIDADTWERQMLVQRDTGVFPLSERQEVKESLTMDQFRERFEREYAEYRQAPSTQMMEHRTYEICVRPKLGNAIISELSRRDFQDLFHHLSKDLKISNERVNRTRQILCCMFNQAVNWELVQVNPVIKTRPLPQRSYIREEAIPFLTQDEVKLLLDWLRIHDVWLYPKVRTLVNTGIRYGEMKGLRVQDIVRGPNGMYLKVSRTYCRYSKKVLERTKGKRSRMIPLGAGLSQMLLEEGRGKKPDAPLLWSNWEEGGFATKFRKHFWDAMEASGVHRVRIHDLRHTFAVHFLERGGQIFDLQKLLGHHSIRLTERYSHFSEAMSERSRGLVDHHAGVEKNIPNFAVIDGGERNEMSHKCPTNAENAEVEKEKASQGFSKSLKRF